MGPGETCGAGFPRINPRILLKNPFLRSPAEGAQARCFVYSLIEHLGYRDVPKGNRQDAESTEENRGWRRLTAAGGIWRAARDSGLRAGGGTWERGKGGDRAACRGGARELTLRGAGRSKVRQVASGRDLPYP